MPTHNLLAQVLVSTMLVFCGAISLLGLALGLGLMLRSAATLPFIALMNRWVSTRQALMPLEAPRHVARPSGTTRWFGVVLVAVGAYAALVLVGSFDVPRLAALLKVDPRYSLPSLALETLKWLLVLGSLGAVLTGLMLLFAPGAWRALGERANRWYSTGSLELAGDMPYMSLDRMVEARPRAAGAVLFALSLVAAAASGILLLGRH
jgi:hypothetical protein